MWQSILEPGRPQMTRWCVCIACWIPKATHTRLGNVILIGFPQQQKLHERASMSRSYLRCLFPLTYVLNSMHCSIGHDFFSNCRFVLLPSSGDRNFSAQDPKQISYQNLRIHIYIYIYIYMHTYIHTHIYMDATV